MGIKDKGWKIINNGKVQKGGVHTSDPKFQQSTSKGIKHDDVFYFWVESILSINKIDTDAEIRKRFLERMTEEEATFYLSQRRKALKEGSEFKLVRYGEPDEELEIISLTKNNPKINVDAEKAHREFETLELKRKRGE